MRVNLVSLLLQALLLLTCTQLYGQRDSNSLQLQRFSPNDVLVPSKRNVEVVSSNRTAQNLRDISYTMHVVTQQEILDNGYNTLVDVLKNVPGIKVSQPGSAVDGESFMMRGFYGNYYTKILINSIPISPSVVGGMPIGAQLPIKQAERIEIIYGPAAAIYGADAMSGVINIILKDPKQSVFAEADISSGSLGFSQLNMMVGGKSGKDKNILNYHIWGGFSQMHDLNTKYDEEENYNPLSYDPDTTFIHEPFYMGDADSAGLEELPTSSQYVGMDITFRNWRFSYQYLTRSYHSSIGLNPLASAYNVEGTQFSDEINRAYLSYKKPVRSLNLITNLSYLKYRIDPESRQFSIQNFQHPESNYYYAASDDLLAEQLVTAKLNSTFNVLIGASMRFSGNLPFTSYLVDPFDPEDYTAFSTPEFSSPPPMGQTGPPDEEPILIPNPYTYTSLSTFGELSYASERITAQIGTRYDNNSEFGTSLSPRIGGTYKFSEKHILRASASRANRIPSAFYRYNTLELKIDMDGEEHYRPARNNNLRTEKLLSAELGMRNYLAEHIEWDVSVYYNSLRNHFTYSVLDNKLNRVMGTDLIGYISDGDAVNTLIGLQSNLSIGEIIQPIHLRTDVYLSYAAGTYQFPLDGGEIDRWPMVPQMMAQVHFELEPIKNIWLRINNHYSGEWIARNTFTEEQLEEDEELLIRDAFYTMDLRVRYKISKHFQAHVKVKNVFDQEYAGISATGTVFDLNYNPQMGRFLEYGLSFRFN